jgi:hypothetical protein
MCDHDGLDEECGPKCKCVCMTCLMGDRDDS